MKTLKKTALVLAGGSGLAASPAFAAGATTGPDFSALTGAIDFSTTTAAILSVAALAIAVTLVVAGARKIMSMIKGA